MVAQDLGVYKTTFLFALALHRNVDVPCIKIPLVRRRLPLPWLGALLALEAWRKIIIAIRAKRRTRKYIYLERRPKSQCPGSYTSFGNVYRLEKRGLNP